MGRWLAARGDAGAGRNRTATVAATKGVAGKRRGEGKKIGFFSFLRNGGWEKSGSSQPLKFRIALSPLPENEHFRAQSPNAFRSRARLAAQIELSFVGGAGLKISSPAHSFGLKTRILAPKSNYYSWRI